MRAAVDACTPTPPPPRSAEPPPPRFINRDALALLLGQGSLPAHATATVLDVRRHDERSLFGAIPGTWHVPVEELPAALNMSSEAWLKRYRFPRPSRSEPVVMQCRTNRRAVWAAAMARDAGYDNVLVYKQGAFGWRLSSKVKAYASYEEGDDVPLAKVRIGGLGSCVAKRGVGSTRAVASQSSSMGACSRLSSTLRRSSMSKGWTRQAPCGSWRPWGCCMRMDELSSLVEKKFKIGKTGGQNVPQRASNVPGGPTGGGTGGSASG